MNKQETPDPGTERSELESNTRIQNHEELLYHISL